VPHAIRFENRSIAVNGLLQGLRALGPMRLAAMAAVAVGTLGLLAVVALWGAGGGAHMALLYADLDPHDAGQVTEQLDRARIAHQVEGDGSRILVPSDQVAQARLLLAKQGLPTGGSIGYEIFDRGDGLTASDFQQQINETRALEGELVRSINMISGVRASRVHLVLPRREPFSRDRQEAQASVLLTMAGAARLDGDAVQAILNLVAAAVPGLKPSNIAVIDSRGNLLARAGAPVEQLAAAQTGAELRRATESRISRAVEEMLERSLGPGHVRAEAAVEMDFGTSREVQESYNPDGQVVRSTQTVSDNSRSTEAQPNVSVANNLPNADAGRTQAGSQDARQEETTNYEINKTVRTVVQEMPQVRRISLAVMVDGVAVPGADGKLVWKDRPADELARIATLVRSAIGYDEKRGDHVEVVSMQFVDPEAGLAPPPGGLLGVMLDRADLLHLAETLIFGVLGILALLLVVRPMVLRVTALAPAGMALVGADGMPLLDGEGLSLAGPGGVGQTMLPGQSGGLAQIEDESMVNVANIEGQMRASVVRRISDLVDKHPEESIAILRGWMGADESGAA
jgi:flagellar M-ring protein FliF